MFLRLNFAASLLALIAIISGSHGKETSIRGLTYGPCIPGDYVSNVGSGLPMGKLRREDKKKTYSYKYTGPPPGVTGDFMGYDPSYFNSYRYGRNFVYRYENCNDLFDYEVTFGFAELNPDFCFEGSREFTILINNEVIVQGFDVYKEAGGCNKVHFLKQTVRSERGILHIRFRSDRDDSSPMLNMIAVKALPSDKQRRQLKQCPSN